MTQPEQVRKPTVKNHHRLLRVYIRYLQNSHRQGAYDNLLMRILNTSTGLALAYLLIILGSASCSQDKAGVLWAPVMPDSIAVQAPRIEPLWLARAIHDNTNSQRLSQGLPALNWSEELSQIAEQHSLEMAEKAYFGHIDPRGHDASERARRAGFSNLHRSNQYFVLGVGENLFATHSYQEFSVHNNGADQLLYQVSWKKPEEIAIEAIEAWINSPSHKRNILSTTYTVEGIGVAIGSNGTLFITQNFN